MKITFPVLIISYLLFSCNSPEEDFILEVIDEPTVNNKTVILDPNFTGLKGLPKDTGGEHKAFPNRGYYIYKPGGYDDNELDYPLILFLHGSGQSSDRTSAAPAAEQLKFVLTHGPPRLIEAKSWKPTYPCLVVSPQSGGDWSAEYVHRILESLIENYRINTNRIYLTGLSMGGRGCWFYEGKMGEDSYAAAIVPICARGDLTTLENLVRTPIWAFHGEDDTVVRAFANGGSYRMVTMINNNDPEFPAKLTIYPGVGHDSWRRTYDSSGMGTESLDYDPFDMSIYDWMFQYRKE